MRATPDRSHSEVLERRLRGLRASGDGPAPQPDPDADPDPDPDQPGFLLPVPGRHASRRESAHPSTLLGRAVVAAVPAPLRGTVGLGAAQLAVVAAVLALGLCAGTWWVLRADASTTEAPAPAAAVEPAADLVALTPVSAESGDEPTEGAAACDPAGAATGSGQAGQEVTVDVAGDVRRPGVVSLPAGSRVVDALEAAGGARPGVDLAPLNLARALVDGEQVLVGEAPPSAAPATAPATTPSTTPSTTGTTPGTATGATSGAPALVDLNTADLTTLETLPEVGPVTAQAIVTWREQNGGFTAVEELLEVDGIGEVTLSQIAPYATV